MRLVIGNKNYSSWSLRPWILMRHARIRFDEVRIPLFTSAGEQLLEELCPARRVPVLYDGPLVLWDSLAICEYVAEKEAAKKLLPQEPGARALARALSAEMHSSYQALRSNMPMNCRREVANFKPDSNTQKDIDRIAQLMEQTLAGSSGPWLFGHYTIADAMFAPVASRFKTYGIKTGGPCDAYFSHVLQDSWMQRWYEDAAHETEVIAEAEID